MKVAIVSLLLGVAFGIKCMKQTPSYSVKKVGGLSFDVSWPGIEYKGLAECGFGYYPEKWACASTKWEGSFTKIERAWNYFITGDETETEYTYESETKGCTPTAVCEKLSGGVDGCQKASYKWSKWIPKSCNASRDFDANEEDYETSVSLACCQSGGDWCNSGDSVYDSCTEAGPFSTYITDLNTCWTDFKRTFMAELFCDGDIFDNDIVTWDSTCANDDGSWKKLKTSACKYRPTCGDEMRQTLLDFSKCACTAATDSGYTGEFIGTLMQANWQKFCPNIKIECASDTGLATLLYKYWLVKYKFIVKLAQSAITDEIKAKIKAKIAEKLNADPITITITIGGTPTTTGTTRRLLADDESLVTASFQAEDEGTRDYGENIDADDMATDIGTEIGATTTKDSVTTEEGSDSSQESFETSGCSQIVSFMAIFIAIIAVFN